MLVGIGVCLVTGAVVYAPKMIEAQAKERRELLDPADKLVSNRARLESAGFKVLEDASATESANEALFRELAERPSVAAMKMKHPDVALGQDALADEGLLTRLKNAANEQVVRSVPDAKAQITIPNDLLVKQVSSHVMAYITDRVAAKDVAEAMRGIEFLTVLSKVIQRERRGENLVAWFGCQLDICRTAVELNQLGMLDASQKERLVAILKDESLTVDVRDLLQAEIDVTTTTCRQIGLYKHADIESLNAEGINTGPPPAHPKSGAAMESEVVGFWADAGELTATLSVEQLGVEIDKLLQAKQKDGRASVYVLRTMSTVYEQYCRMIQRSAQAKAVALKLLEGEEPTKTTMEIGGVNVKLDRMEADGGVWWVAKSELGGVAFKTDRRFDVDQAAGVRGKVR